MRYWEVRRLREGRSPRNYGSYYAASEDDALLRLLHTKGVAAYMNKGKLIYDRPVNIKVWGTRSDWSIRPWVSGKSKQLSQQIKERSVAMVQTVKGDYL